MSELALVPGDMRSAAATVESAAGRARGADGSDALSTLAGALPGSTTAETVPDLGDAWETGVNGWADEVAAFSASVEQLNDDAGSTDDSAAGRLLGGGPR
ncbi:hypothetical protein GCM10027062_12970 [Nocardioides hungaricus]